MSADVLQLYFQQLRVPLHCDITSGGTADVDNLGGPKPAWRILLLLGPVDVHLFTNLQVQLLGRTCRSCVVRPAQACGNCPLDHRLDAYLT